MFSQEEVESKRGGERREKEFDGERKKINCKIHTLIVFPKNRDDAPRDATPPNHPDI